MAIQKITSGIIQDGAIAAADIVSVANTAITGNITSSQIAPDQTLNGNVSVTGTLSTPNTFGFKNRIINGGMVIDQRNAGASVTPTDGSYDVDRWSMRLTQASKYTSQQSSTAPAGFTKSLLVTSSSAYSVGIGDYFAIEGWIEGYNTADLGWGAAGAKTVTLSFWVRSSLTGTFGGSLRTYAGGYSFPFSYTISSANTWEQKTVTITGATAGTWYTTNSGSIGVVFSLGAGSSFSGTANAWAASTYFQPTGSVSVVGTSGATFYVTGVQLEAGSTATSFDFRDYGREFAMCQRYYQRIFNWAGLGDTTTTIGANAQFFVPMRASATVTKITGSTLSWRTPVTDNTSITWTFSAAVGLSTCVWFQIGSVTGITAGQAINNRGYGTDIAEASAEL